MTERQWILMGLIGLVAVAAFGMAYSTRREISSSGFIRRQPFTATI